MGIETNAGQPTWWVKGISGSIQQSIIATPLQCLSQNSYNISCETGSLEVSSPGLVHWPNGRNLEVAHVTAAPSLLARAGHRAPT